MKRFDEWAAPEQSRGHREFPVPRAPARAVQEGVEPLLRVRSTGVAGRRGPVGITARRVVTRPGAHRSTSVPRSTPLSTSARQSCRATGTCCSSPPDRPGGLGGFDIWVAWRVHTHDDFGWQPAVNLGSGVNSGAGDFGPSYFANDEIGIPILYFASNRPGGLGNADIYRSQLLPDGSFGPAVPVSELNSPQGDFRPSIRGDGLEIVFDSNRPGPPDVPGIGLRDLWVATRSSPISSRGRSRRISVPFSTARSTTTSRCCRPTEERS